MRFIPLAVALTSMVLPGGIAIAQGTGKTLTFDVASVKSSQRLVGPDENNRFSVEPSRFTGRNVTVKRLIAEAYHLQLSQVLGPTWLDQSEYDIDATTDGSPNKEQLAQMLRALLAERFKLLLHSESRDLRVYELVVGKAGPKIGSISGGTTAAQSAGFHFHGDLQRLADLLAVQLSIPTSDDPRTPGRASGSPIPALDKTALPGIYDFEVDIKPEAGSDMFALWQRLLQDRFGFEIESPRANMPVLVVDRAERTPTAN